MSTGAQALNQSMSQLATNINRKLESVDAKSMGTILNLFYETGNDNSFTVNNTETLYQLIYFRFICHKIKLIDVITIHTSLSISHDYIMLRITTQLKSAQLRCRSLYIYHMM